MAAQPPQVLFVGICTFGGVTYSVWGTQDYNEIRESHGVLRHMEEHYYEMFARRMEVGAGGNGGGGVGGGGNGGGGDGDGGGEGGELFRGFVKFGDVYYRVRGILIGTPHNHPEHYGMVVHNGNIYAVVGRHFRPI